MISDNKNNPYIKQHDWDKPKEEDLTVGEWNKALVEWIDGHKLDDSAYISMSSREMKDDEIDEQNDPIFTTDKDGYVYVDIEDKK